MNRKIDNIKIMKDVPKPSKRIVKLLSNNPSVVPMAKNKILNPEPVPLLSVGSISIVISIKHWFNPQ